MKILLIGNYPNSRQQSMERFAELIRAGVADAGHEVRFMRPPVWVGRGWQGETGLGKWIGYVDRFVLYPPYLRRLVHWADLIHICDQANAVYLPSLLGKPHLITCHDMLAIRAALSEIPESPTGLTGRIYQRWILNNLKKARAVACVSAQTRSELLRVAGLPEGSVTVVPNGLNYPYRPMPADEARHRIAGLGLTDARPFFLHVGGNQWYKNRLGVLRIFARLATMTPYQDHRLVMAGKDWTPEMRSLVKTLALGDRVVECGEVSNEDLRALYSTAEALLFPSLQEGFGWPIAEAQACGCVVVTTDRPPMNEVGGTEAIYFDPAQETEAAQCIAEGLRTAEARRTAGLINASRFAPATMIDAYLRCYRKAFAEQSAELAAPAG
jgi:glycosyltransferase involved in cell wall biosynthesis